MWFKCRKKWTDRHLESVKQKLNAPFEMVGMGMLSHGVAEAVSRSSSMVRLRLIRNYLEQRKERNK